jgi:hypothetical protein
MRRVLAEAAVIWVLGLVWSGLVRWWSYERASAPGVTVDALHDALAETAT